MARRRGTRPVAASTAPTPDAALFDHGPRRWLAGDHHIHSEFSARYEEGADPALPPVPTFGGDGRYSILDNARQARAHGLAWMVSTDHGGPHHSKINHALAWPAVEDARRQVPEVLVFFGMEFDTPGGDHSSLIMPHSHDERDHLHTIESRWSQRDAWPRDPARDTEPKMIEALEHMRGLETPPVLIANHPSRAATGVGVYGKYDPAEFRAWNGDSMFGKDRRWWVTSTSDSHRHWREGGSDFHPGEYSKTYVLAAHDHDDILVGLRNGRVFVTTGDLVSELDVVVRSGGARAGIGGSLHAHADEAIEVAIRVRDPAGPNHGGRSPPTGVATASTCS